MNKSQFFTLLKPYATEVYSRPYSGPRQGLDWPDCFKLNFKRTEGQTVFTRPYKGALEIFAAGKAAEVVAGLLGKHHEVRPNSTGHGRETMYYYWKIKE